MRRRDRRRPNRVVAGEGPAPNHEVTVIDHNPDVADVFQAMDVELLTGSGTSAEVLAQADVRRADFLGAGEAGSLSAFGISRVVWPEAQLAADIERIVTTPGAIRRDDLSRLRPLWKSHLLFGGRSRSGSAAWASSRCSSRSAAPGDRWPRAVLRGGARPHR